MTPANQQRLVARWLCAACLLGLAGSLGSAAATTFVVSSTADAGDAAPGNGVCDDGSGACTLRAAIREANALAGADVVELPAGTYVLAIAGKGEDLAATGDLDIRSDLTLIGAGAAVTIVDAASLDRVFEFPQGGAPYAVTLSGLTMTHGDATGSGLGFGGGIAVTNGSSNSSVTLTLEDVVITANNATTRGCGLWVQGQNQVVVRASQIRDHACPNVGGAGIDTTSSLEIYDSTVSGNTGSTGGGLRTFACGGANVVIERSLFSNNTAYVAGAIENNNGCILTVRESTLDGNQALVLGSDGGYAGVIDNMGVVRFFDSRVTNNWADVMAGAVNSGGSGSTRFDATRTLFAGNSAGSWAGAASVASQATLTNVTFSGNRCCTGAAGEAGALWVLGASAAITLVNGTFFGNENVSGGAGAALAIYGSGSITLADTIIAGSLGGANCSGTPTSAGYNLDDGTSCGLSATGDLSSADPLLAPLADNGGWSSTHALQPGSPAIDAGDPGGSCAATDQRGAPRPVDGDGDGLAVCDMGAYEVAPEADLAAGKDDGQTTAVPGESVVYALAVANAGPEDATGALVTDRFDDPPFDRAQVSWTCAPDPGAGSGTVCPASGTGDELAAGVTVDVEVAASLTFTVTAPIRPDATGSLDNTALVASPATFDPVAANDSDSDSDLLVPEADLSISKDDGLADVVPGGSLTYTIAVANAGPSAEPAAAVSDIFPADLDCTWTCLAAGGASCPPGPVAGDIAAIVGLPVGDSATFTAQCDVSPAAAGPIVNTASILASSGVTDPVPGNDSASDTTNLRALDFGDAPDPDYPTRLASDGARHGVVAGFHLGAGVDADADGQPTPGADGDDGDGNDDEDGVSFLPVIPGATARATVTASAPGRLDAWVDFDADGDWGDPGEQIAADLALAAGANEVAFAVPATGPLGTTVARFRYSSSGGLAPGGIASDGEVEDHLVELVTGGDLAVAKSGDLAWVYPDDLLTYTVEVGNLGPFAASGVELVDPLPAEVSFVSVIPGPPTCDEAASTVTCQVGSLDPGESFLAEIAVLVVGGASSTSFTNVAVVSGNEPDPDPSNDTAAAETGIPLLFRDGFESGDTDAWSAAVP